MLARFHCFLIPSVTLCVTPPLEHQGEARDRRLKSNRDILAALRALLPSRQAVPPSRALGPFAALDVHRTSIHSRETSRREARGARWRQTGVSAVVFNGFEPFFLKIFSAVLTNARVCAIL